jgi:glycosyltransferase involved in cell wall biosynthesis
LIVLCGDADSDYVRQVKLQLAESPEAQRVIVVEDWLEASDVAGWLQLADFALSVPTWDQMSNSVLEGMACGALPILARVGGYRTLEERNAPVCWLEDINISTLEGVLAETASLSEERRRQAQGEAVDFIRQHYANRRVWEVLQPLYNLPSKAEASRSRAA